ncbi:class I SAM-dependent methyltransferase [Azospirillum thermophilum]|uniref:Methyltransferase n=1 Tax=Azospirillum thermophilum TaxID=2202148 RepID=A0A2S2CVI1_9PROT|nr:class I SAM-dependent methyltransferase [Azospirillum thermophilum]AWK88486.1 methyltransferase [Azospirillum thermophilum]
MKIDRCRSCSAPDLLPVLDLGSIPVADRLVAEADLGRPEQAFPLNVVFCPHCGLVQIDYTVPPEDLFCRDYPYYSSFSPELLRHSRENALELMGSRGLGPDSFVVELASNDGYLLRNFVEAGIPVLGIDPAAGPAAAARDRGVPTEVAFFDSALARRIRDERGRADVIIANNVLAHVAGLNDFVEAIAILLAEDGVASIEMPYVRDLVDHCEFDTIYHQHLCYFSLTALTALMGRHGLWVNDVRRLPIHGGSLRIHVGHREEPGEAVTALLAEERTLGIDRIGYYLDFGVRVERLRETLRATLAALRDQGLRLAAYGAAAKGATLINYVGIGRDLIDYVVDRNHHKHGRYMTGQRLPILPVETLSEDRPDCVLLLSWNFADEILAQQQAYRDAGGRFLVPIPEVRIV